MLVCSWVRVERVDGQLFVQFWKTVPVCTLAWAEQMLQPHLFHDIAPHWHEGCYGQGENSLWDTEVAQTQSVSEQCGGSHRWHLDSQHIRGRPNLCLSGLPKPPPWPTPRAHTGPPCPLERQKTRAREHSPSGEFSCRTKEAWRSEAVSDQDTGNHYYYLHMQHIRSNLFSVPGWTTASHSPNHVEFSHQPLLVKHCYPLGQGCQCWKGRELHLKWMEPAQTWSSGLLLLLFGTLLHS